MISMVPKTARPTRQVRPTTLPIAVADGADPVQRALDAGAVVVAEGAHVVHHVLDVLGRDLAIDEDLLTTGAPETGLRSATQVHDDLDDVGQARHLPQTVGELRRQGVEQGLQVIGGMGWGAGWHGPSLGWRGHQRAGTSAGSATRTSASLTSRDTRAMTSMPSSSSRRSTGDS